MAKGRMFVLAGLGVILFVALWLSLRTTQKTDAQDAFTTTPVIVGTRIVPTATFANCLPPLDFEAGDIIVLQSGISVRVAPSASSPLLEQFPELRRFTVVEGPVCQDGFNWWRIRGHGLNGWAAEGRGNDYWMWLVESVAGEACGIPLDLVPGERFELLNNVRVRAEPSLEALTLTVAPADSSVIILGDPQCTDGLNWWPVRATVLDIVYDGWMAEANRDGDSLIDVPPDGDGTICRNPLNLSMGDRARVTYRDGVPKRLRAAPNLNATVLYELVLNVPLEIVGGPVCAATYNWWQVRVLASTEVVGWLAEGGPAQYWIRKN